jgi:hypothetical protein
VEIPSPEPASPGAAPDPFHMRSGGSL